jgi:hypothetical protein
MQQKDLIRLHAHYHETASHANHLKHIRDDGIIHETSREDFATCTVGLCNVEQSVIRSNQQPISRGVKRKMDRSPIGSKSEAEGERDRLDIAAPHRLRIGEGSDRWRSSALQIDVKAAQRYRHTTADGTELHIAVLIHSDGE